MFKFISFGSGSSGNCYYLSTGDTSILIDAGVSVRLLKKYFRDMNLNLEDIDAVFVTHDHADHIKAVSYLANDMNCPIYATEAVHLGINRNYCVTNKLTSEHIRFVNKGENLTMGDFNITPFEVPHDSSDCVGYRVKVGETIFCLITDVGHSTPEIEEEVQKAHYLVLEANHDENMLMMGTYPAYLKGRIRSEKGHLSNKSSAKLLAEHGTPKLQQVWLCHLSEENNHPELARKTMETVLREYGIVPGVDFRIDVLRRKLPSEIYELKVF